MWHPVLQPLLLLLTCAQVRKAIAAVAACKDSAAVEASGGGPDQPRGSVEFTVLQAIAEPRACGVEGGHLDRSSVGVAEIPRRLSPAHTGDAALACPVRTRLRLLD